jgi:putative DNA primase/helicase
MKDVYRALMGFQSPPVVKIVRLSGLPEKGDIVDWLQSHNPERDGYQPFPESEKAWALSELKVELKKAEPVPESWLITDASNNGDWSENPVEIVDKLKPVQSFDIELLPNIFKSWVRDVSYRMQCPPDFVAVAGMVAISAVVGKKGLICPKSRDDWKVCPNLNGLNIGRPSAMKTPASDEAIKPLQRLEIKAKESYTFALSDNETQAFINKEGRALAEKAAKKFIKDKKFDTAKQLLNENPEEPDKPTRARYIVNDATVEKLGELLNENPNGLMLYRDEISGFLKTIDREDRSNDRAFYLECFNGLGRYTYDRIGRGTIDIESLCLAILGNIQPGVLRPYLNQATKGTSGDDGMIQRFQLMVWPDLTDWKFVDQWPDTDAKNQAFEVFDRLANWMGFDESARFDEPAQKLFDAWSCNLHQELRAEDIPPVLESHFAKYKSLIPSLAILIHLADDKTHRPVVGVDAVKKAISWGDYLKSHALRVYGAALDPVNANAKTILDKIDSGKLSDGFSLGDVLRGGWSGLDSLDSVKAALARLVDLGWIRQITLPTSALGGRPSIRYQVHPKILSKTPA